MNRHVFSWALIAAAIVFGADAARAVNLEAAPDAPLWAHFGADALLFLHIGGGAVGMLSGVASLSTRKGGRLHRIAGTVFFASMLIAYAIGAGVAPFLTEGQRPNFVAGIMALYLLLSGWMTVRRPAKTAGMFEIAGLVIAVAVAGAGALFMYMGAQSPTGTIDGSPPQAFILFAFAGTVAALGEINLLVRRGIDGGARVARHLWRMCFSLFIASGSFFLGQMQVQPKWMRESALPFVLALAPLAALVFWLVWVRLAGGRRIAARPAQ
ncbi:MAG: hypothetical protein IV086_03425 [Hyphomonadaceae bacterium]|nr:hypothetical protein [Hyphomonadaceae bacterium]